MASEKDSGLEKADRSRSSDHGRRLAKPVWTVVEMWLMNEPNAGVGPICWVVSVLGCEIGRTAGEAIFGFVNQKRERERVTAKWVV